MFDVFSFNQIIKLHLVKAKPFSYGNSTWKF